MNFFRDERGQTSILVAASLLCLCGMAGLAVDVGTMFRAKRILQTAADAGAIAGTAELYYGDWNAAGKAAAARNGVTDGTNGYTVVVNNPPTSGVHTASTKYVEVIATQAAPTFFMKLFHISSMTVSARAVAGNGPGNACILTLDASGNDIGLSGSGDLMMQDCGILVNSASSNALTISNNANLTAQSIGIVGGYTGGTTGNLNPTPVTGVAPGADPLAGRLTKPTFNPATCLADPHPNPGTGATVTLGPATATGTICYNGLSASGSGTVNLNPGLYIINGGFSQSGSVQLAQTPGTGQASGTGTTFYLAAPNGSLSLTGSGALNIAAPNDSLCPTCTPNPYNGILFYQDPNDTNSMKVGGSNGSNMSGIFYAANASLSLAGSSGANFNVDLVVSTLGLAGTNNLSNYAKINKDTPLTAPRVVE